MSLSLVFSRTDRVPADVPADVPGVERPGTLTPSWPARHGAGMTPNEQNSPTDAQAGLTIEGVLSRVPEALAAEWRAAHVEVQACGAALGRAMSGGEAEALVAAKVLAGNVVRVAVRMARVAKAVSLAYEAWSVAELVQAGLQDDMLAAARAEAQKPIDRETANSGVRGKGTC